MIIESMILNLNNVLKNNVINFKVDLYLCPDL